MKFIIPSNFDFKPKFLGLIEYDVIIFNVIWNIFIFCLLNLLFSNINLKVILFILFNFPILIMSIVGFNHENILYVAKYIIKFSINKNIYLYKKY